MGSYPYTANNIAAFSITSGSYSYYMGGNWNSAIPTWYPIYDQILGEPLGKATLVDDDIWRTEFKHGAEVGFDTNTETGNIQWPKNCST